MEQTTALRLADIVPLPTLVGFTIPILPLLEAEEELAANAAAFDAEEEDWDSIIETLAYEAEVRAEWNLACRWGRA